MIVLSSEEEDRYGRDHETLEVTIGVDVTFFLSGEREVLNGRLGVCFVSRVSCVGGIRIEKIKCVGFNSWTTKTNEKNEETTITKGLKLGRHWC